jgi:hypothetical protein
MPVNTFTAGTTTGTEIATEFNKVANALNTIGQYSHASTVALTTTPSAIPVSTNDIQAGSISHSISTNTSRFTATADGDFVFIIQPQISHITTGTGTATFWLRKNGTTPVGNSGAIFQMGAVVGSDVLVITSVIPLVANDYIEVMAVASANSEHQITFTATSGTGATAVPNIPSMIVTVTQLPL